jgi:glutamate transport system substrate-binding protein
MKARRIAVCAVTVTLGLFVAACGGGRTDSAGASVNANASFASDTTMAELNAAQKIAIGTKFDQPGFGLKGLDGNPAGFDVEIGKIIAGELGIPSDKIEWVETPTKVREDSIEQGKVDLVVATYTINDKRKERVEFAGPYYVAGQSVMVRADDTSVTGPDSFRDASLKICSVTGAQPAETIKTYLRDVDAQLVLFDTYDKCRDALASKQVDAVTTDNVILLGYVAKNPGAFKLTGDTFTNEPYGIGLEKGDIAFRDFVNDVLEKIYADGRWVKAWQETAGKFDSTPVSPPAVNRY